MFFDPVHEETLHGGLTLFGKPNTWKHVVLNALSSVGPPSKLKQCPGRFLAKNHVIVLQCAIRVGWFAVKSLFDPV